MENIYCVNIIEYNGEQEYSHEIYVVAPTLAEAQEWARDFAADFYAEAEPDTALDKLPCWQIEGGAVAWCLVGVTATAEQIIFDTTARGQRRARLVLED